MLTSHNSQVSTTETAGVDNRRRAVMDRDPAADGQFVYAVTSTGVFCRPSCPSRRPRADRIRFFDTPAAAAGAGFRPCRRCHPTAQTTADAAITRATRYLTRHADRTVELATLARVAGLSASHLQRRFKQIVGVSPREYQAACRAERFRGALRRGSSVTSAVYEAGYGSPSRVYDAAPTGRGMSPASYRRGGQGLEVGFVTVACSLGWLLVAATPHGLCAVRLGDSSAALEAELRREFPHAHVTEAAAVPAPWVAAIVNGVEGGGIHMSLPLDVRATAFQWKVWRALQTIERGETRSYSDIARQIGRPAAVRAVARACATNPLGLVIPCHRVVARSGAPGGYRWGSKRKQQLLGREKAGRIGPE